MSDRARSAEGRLTGRLIVLGVTGSIAAYKAAELTRLLQAEGAEVQVVMTDAARRFIGPLTFETLTRRPALLDPLRLLPDGRIGHIVAADSADAIVVAPATARWIAAMAHGLSTDEITATALAAWGGAPVVVAPAMDGEMYTHPATAANVDRLRAFGYGVVEPEVGPLASGQSGRGRLAEPAHIVDVVAEAVAGRAVREPDPALRPPLLRTSEPPSDDRAPTEDLAGRRIVVTAGGTAEPIDPVRFIGNRSTGRMGVAVAEAALARGAEVTLIVGLTSVPLPRGATIIRAESTERMRQAVLETLPDLDALVMAAAVADFRPRATAPGKLERTGALTVELEATPDILAEVGRLAAARQPRPVLVGFAAETGSLERAPAKAARKGVDLLVANDVSEPGSGFGTDTNRVTLVQPGANPEPWPLMSKRDVAYRLVTAVADLLRRRDAGAYSGPESPAPLSSPEAVPS